MAYLKPFECQMLSGIIKLRFNVGAAYLKIFIFAIQLAIIILFQEMSLKLP